MVSSQENDSIWLVDWTLTDTTTPGQSRPRSNGNERGDHILQISSLNIKYSLASYLEYLCGGGYPSADRLR